MQASNATGQSTLAATKLLTALRSSVATTLPSLTTLIGSFSLTDSQLDYAIGSVTLDAVACVTQQATLTFAVDFGERQSDAAVQSASADSGCLRKQSTHGSGFSSQRAPGGIQCHHNIPWRQSGIHRNVA